jgi:diguanylate cyclase (GGDEF)-like protein
VERDLATQDAQHIREVKQHFEYQAYHDALTGLPNRILFNKLIQEGIAACANKDENLIVFYIDVDDFKRINDCYGHTVGDELLRLFAHRLKAGLRESDVTARLGGDEFAAILMRTGLSQAEATAEALVGALSHPYMIDEVAVVVSASIGAAGYPDSGSTPEELLKHADAAMYQAKTNGKHRCVFHQSIDSGSAS